MTSVDLKATMESVHPRVFDKLSAVPHSTANKAIEVMRNMEKKGDLSHSRLYSGFQVDPTTKKEHQRLMTEIVDFQHFREDEPYDKVLHSLLIIIVIFSTSSLILKNTKILDNLQSKYSMLLFRYLKSKLDSKAYTKFNQGLMVVESSKRAYELHCKIAITG